MSQTSRDPLEVLAESFMERYRRGEGPSVEEYAERHPELAESIRELFPALCVMEEFAPEGRPSEASSPPEGWDKLRRLGDYRILREIGRGGMGIVFEAEQESLGRKVALKVLPFRNLLDDTQIERFRREARAAARLHHANIVPVFGVGEDGGLHYYAMQYIHGQSLAQVLEEVRRLRRLNPATPWTPSSRPEATITWGLVTGSFEVAADGPTDPSDDAQDAHVPRRGDRGAQAVPAPDRPGSAGDRGNRVPPVSGTSLASGDGSSTSRVSEDTYYRSIARVGLQVAEALDHAHREGILHRDVKPSNLLLDTRGVVWITDFGLAKADGAENLTQTGSVIGTLRYMAPERLEGHSDSRSDVYSLGVTLYELLTLSPAFSGNDRARLIRDIAAREPPAPRRLDARIPRDLETIVLKSLAKGPEARYASAGELADDLRRFLSYQTILARRANVPERLWRWYQRNPVVAVLGTALTILLALLCVGAVLAAARLAKERNDVVATLSRARIAEAEVGRRLAESRLAEGRAWRMSQASGRKVRALAALAGAVSQAPALEVRNEVAACLALVDLEVLREWKDFPPGLIFDAESRRAAARGPAGSILVYQADDLKRPTRNLDGLGCDSERLRFSPSGRYLAAKCRDVAVWDLADGRLIHRAAHAPKGFAVSFDPEESRVAFGLPDGSISVRSLPAGDEVLRIRDVPPVTTVEWHPDGSRLAITGSDDTTHAVWVHDIGVGGVVARLHHPDRVADVAWSPDNRLMAAACFDRKVHLWDAVTFRRIRICEGHGAEVVHVAFSPRGDLLASTAWDGRTALWDPDTGLNLAFATGNFTNFRVEDGALGFEEGDYRRGLWRVDGRSEYRALAGGAIQQKGPQEAAISPDGLWLAAACGGAGARIWCTGRPDEWSALEPGSVDDLVFLPDGALLTTGSAGVLRWSLARDGEGRSTLGPPLAMGFGAKRLAVAREGSRIAASRGHHAVVYEIETSPREIARFHHAQLDALDLSPNGQWLVTTTWHGSGIRIWSVEEGRLLEDLPGSSAKARFSPDERWLVVGLGEKYAFHETSSWNLRHEVPREGAGDMPGPVAFSSDSRFVALAGSRTRIHLHLVETGEEVLRLEAPGPWAELAAIEVSSSGDVVAGATSRDVVQLWDLSRIRSRLRLLGLDWDPAEPLPAAREASALSIDHGTYGRRGDPPPQDPGALDATFLEFLERRLQAGPNAPDHAQRAVVFDKRGLLHDALGELDDAVRINPSAPGLHIARARILAKLGRRGQAIESFDRAVEILRVSSDPEGARATLEMAVAERATLLAEGDE